MKISIITVCFNSAKFIEDSLNSVISQKGNFVKEHILIDGNSTDGTVDIIKKYSNQITKFISESDQGIYDAMNKGLQLATGEVIGILNADDVYNNEEVLKKVAQIFENNPELDALYGDLVYVKRDNLHKIVRYWQAGAYKSGLFELGWMPPHPTFFVRKSVYTKYGLFNLAFPLAGDYELMLRFIQKQHIGVQYYPEVLVKMRLGGASNKSLKNLIQNYYENINSWKVNGLKHPWYTIILKRLQKIPQYWYTYTVNMRGR